MGIRKAMQLWMAAVVSTLVFLAAPGSGAAQGFCWHCDPTDVPGCYASNGGLEPGSTWCEDDLENWGCWEWGAGECGACPHCGIIVFEFLHPEGVTLPNLAQECDAEPVRRVAQSPGRIVEPIWDIGLREVGFFASTNVEQWVRNEFVRVPQF